MQVPTLPGIKIGSVLLDHERVMLCELGMLNAKMDRLTRNIADTKREIKGYSAEANEVNNDELLDKSDKRSIVNSINNSKNQAVKLYSSLLKEMGNHRQQYRRSADFIRRANDDSQVTFRPETPLDLQRSVLGPSSDSDLEMNIDCHFIQKESNSQTNVDFASNISTYVGNRISAGFGVGKGSAATGMSLSTALTSSLESQKLAGTLVVVCSAKHKKSTQFKKIVLDPDKAVRAWNTVADMKKEKTNLIAQMFGQSQFNMAEMTYIDTATIPMDILSTAFMQKNPMLKRQYMDVVTSATYGSTFVALVHVLKTEKSFSYQDAVSFASNVKASLDVNLWLAKSSGEVASTAEVTKRLQSLISTVAMDTHCEIFTQGVIPSIASKEMQAVIKKLKIDPSENMESLSKYMDGNSDAVNSVSKTAVNARKMGEFSKLDHSYMKNAVQTVSEIDTAANKVIDINSVMTALDEYLEKVEELEGGVLIGYGLTRLTKLEIMKNWWEAHKSDGDDIFPDSGTKKIGKPEDDDNEDQNNDADEPEEDEDFEDDDEEGGDNEE